MSLEQTKTRAPEGDSSDITEIMEKSFPRWYPGSETLRNVKNDLPLRPRTRQLLQEFFRDKEQDIAGSSCAQLIVYFVVGDLCHALQKRTGYGRSQCEYVVMDLFGMPRTMRVPVFNAIVHQTYLDSKFCDWFARRDMDKYIRCAAEGIAETILSYIPPISSAHVHACLRDIDDPLVPIDRVRSFLWGWKNDREVEHLLHDDEWDVAHGGDALVDLKCNVFNRLFKAYERDDSIWTPLNENEVDLSITFERDCPYLFSDVQLFCVLYTMTAVAQHRERDLWRRIVSKLVKAR